MITKKNNRTKTNLFTSEMHLQNILKRYQVSADSCEQCDDIEAFQQGDGKKTRILEATKAYLLKLPIGDQDRIMSILLETTPVSYEKNYVAVHKILHGSSILGTTATDRLELELIVTKLFLQMMEMQNQHKKRKFELATVQLQKADKKVLEAEKKLLEMQQQLKALKAEM